MAKGGAFSRGGRPDEHVPGQGIESCFPFNPLPDRRLFQSRQALIELAAQCFQLLLMVRPGRRHLNLGLLLQRYLQLHGTVLRDDMLDDREDEPQ